jgi:hypothetical protein
MRITYERAMRVMQQVHDEAEAKRSLAGRIYPTLIPKPKAEDEAKRRPP